MKLKRNAVLAVALVGALFSSQASAIDTTSSGYELFLVAYNSTGSGKTFVASISPSVIGSGSSFNGTLDFANVSNGYKTNWDTFAASTGFSTATTFQLLGFNNGTELADSKAFMTSFPALTNTSLTKAAYSSFYDAADSTVAIAEGDNGLGGRLYNTMLVDLGSVTGAGSSAIIDGTSPGSYSAFGNNFGNQFSNNTTASLGGSLGLYSVVNGLGSTFATVQNLGTATLSTAGSLTVASVPESDPMSMMVVGLGVLGLIARRRIASV